MLATLRENSRNVLIYVIFGIIIAAFIISFGGPVGKAGMPGTSNSYAAKVAGSTVTEQDFRFAYIALGGAQFPGQLARERRLKEFVMDKLIDRELFANKAEKLGFAVSAKEVEDMIADGRMMVMGVPRRVDSYVFKDGKFDYDRFKMVAQNQLGVSVRRFIEIQQRELLADKVRELLKVGTKVSPEEVKLDYEQRGTQVNLEYVRFSPRRFEDDSEPTQKEIDDYVASHKDELTKLYEDRAFLYKKLDKQARLRHIFVPIVTKPAATAPKEKDGSDEDEASTKEDPQAVEAARKKIEEAHAKLKAGTPFIEVAKQYSADERSKRRGGLIGWKKKGFTGFGDTIDSKIFTAKKGDTVGPERIPRGFEIVYVDGFREGDVPMEEAMRELAEEAVLAERAKAKAKAEAEAVLARVKKGEKLEVIVPKDSGAHDDDDKQGLGILSKLNEAPKLKETGLFARRGEMVQDIGLSKELSKRAFDLKPGEVAGPFEASGSVVIVRLKERKDPDMADYEKRKDDLQREYERTKWAEVLDSWSKERCEAVRDDGRIKVNAEVLTYEGTPASKPDKAPYQPCAGTKL